MTRYAVAMQSQRSIIYQTNINGCEKVSGKRKKLVGGDIPYFFCFLKNVRITCVNEYLLPFQLVASARAGECHSAAAAVTTTAAVAAI